MLPANRPNYLANTSGRSLARAATGGLARSLPPYISLNGDKFTLMEANNEPNPLVPAALTLDVIVVGSNEHASRVYWGEDDYDSNSLSPPICFSDNGVGASASASQPQNAHCATCPKSKWDQPGFTKGQLVPACKTVKKIAVITPTTGEAVYLLSIPSKSLKIWDRYINLLNTHHTEVFQLVTRIGWNKDNSKTLTFEPIDWYPEEWMPIVDRLCGPECRGSAEVRTAVNADDRVWEGQAALPAPVKEYSGVVLPPQQQFASTPVSGQFAQQSLPPNQFGPRPPPQLASEPIEPKRRGRPAKAETVVGPGPIAPATFAPPAPPLEGSPAASGFIGGPSLNTGFGAPPAPANADMDAMLERALGGPGKTTFG